MQGWIKKLESDCRRSQMAAAHFLQFVDGAYDSLPLLIDKAQDVDVDNGVIDLVSSNFVGSAIRTSAKLIRNKGFSEFDEFHKCVKKWIFELNYCSELNVAAHSIHALGELWIPPESVRQRLIELAHIERRPDNRHPNTIRGLAFRMLSRHDRQTASNLIDTPARLDFQNAINHWLDEYRVKYPDNENVPRNLKAEVAWLADANAG